jgi:hypothetical protein
MTTGGNAAEHQNCRGVHWADGLEGQLCSMEFTSVPENEGIRELDEAYVPGNGH